MYQPVSPQRPSLPLLTSTYVAAAAKTRLVTIELLTQVGPGQERHQVPRGFSISCHIIPLLTTVSCPPPKGQLIIDFLSVKSDMKTVAESQLSDVLPRRLCLYIRNYFYTNNYNIYTSYQFITHILFKKFDDFR